ncbi:MAG: ATP-binding protein, partial [Gemmatimonadales bacterium]
ELVPDHAAGRATTTFEARHAAGTPMRLRLTVQPIADDERALVATVFGPPDPAPLTEERHPFDPFHFAVLRFDALRRVIYANSRSTAFAGRPRRALIGMRPADFALSSAMGRRLETVIAEVIRTGDTSRVELSVGDEPHETWYDATIAVEGRPGLPTTTALLTAHDVTVHHLAEEELEASERRFRRLAEGSQDVISQHDREGRFRYASPAAADLFGREPDALVGSLLSDHVHAEDRARVLAAIGAAAAGERGHPVEFRVIKADGSSVVAEITTHLSDPGRPGDLELICITRDISERVKSEEVLRAASRMEATATLAAGVAHDFNNLMTGILGNAELLLTDPTYPDAAARLSQIADSANRGGQLAQQLLAYARGGKYQTATVDLNDVVRQSLSLQRHSFPPRIQIEEDTDPHLPSVYGDPVQLGQVVTNLSINAAEAIRGTGRITIRTRPIELGPGDLAGRPGLAPGLHVRLEVTDDGPGIEADVLPRIFEPFFTTKLEGRGLGLAAVSGIVRNHRGSISVTSDPGRGTTFSIFLPATAGKAARPAEPYQGYPSGQETVLLIDDDRAVLEVTGAILERLQYQVLVARHGVEAVEIARTHPADIHLALLDLGMPLAGGAEAFPSLKIARPEMRVLIVSGYERNDVVSEMIAAGADGFLQKPFRVGDLARAIRAVLDRTTAESAPASAGPAPRSSSAPPAPRPTPAGS